MRQWQRRKTRDQSKEGKKAFQNLQRQLRLIQDENDVDCLYLGIVDAPTLSMIYLVDGAHRSLLYTMFLRLRRTGLCPDPEFIALSFPGRRAR